MKRFSNSELHLQIFPFCLIPLKMSQKNKGLNISYVSPYIMVKIQLDLPEKINKKIAMESVRVGLNDKRLTIIKILKEWSKDGTFNKNIKCGVQV